MTRAGLHGRVARAAGLATLSRVNPDGHRAASRPAGARSSTTAPGSASTPSSGTSPHSKPEPGCSETSPPQRKQALSRIRGELQFLGGLPRRRRVAVEGSCRTSSRQTMSRARPIGSRRVGSVSRSRPLIRLVMSRCSRSLSPIGRRAKAGHVSLLLAATQGASQLERHAATRRRLSRCPARYGRWAGIAAAGRAVARVGALRPMVPTPGRCPWPMGWSSPLIGSPRCREVPGRAQEAG
jgi:hypothetical protein